MARITWTDPAPVDGTTVLTAAMWEQLKDDIAAVLGEAGVSPGNVDKGNLKDGVIPREQLASGNQDVIQPFTVPLINAVPATGEVGFSQASGSADEFYGLLAKSTGTIVSVDYVADSVADNACTVQLAVAGSAVGTSTSLAVSTSQQVGEQPGLALAVSESQRIGILVQGSGGTTKVFGGFAVVHFKRTLA